MPKAASGKTCSVRGNRATNTRNSQAFVEFASQQAATAFKHQLEEPVGEEDGQPAQRRLSAVYAPPFSNPYKTLPKDGATRRAADSGNRGAHVGSNSTSGFNDRTSHGPAAGSFGGGYRGNRGGFNPRGGRGGGGMGPGGGYQNNFNNNMNSFGNNMGMNNPMSGGWGGGFRGGMMGGMGGGPMRGGPNMRGRGGMGNPMMGNMGMGGMPMGPMPGGMNMMGAGMPGQSSSSLRICDFTGIILVAAQLIRTGCTNPFLLNQVSKECLGSTPASLAAVQVEAAAASPVVGISGRTPTERSDLVLNSVTTGGLANLKHVAILHWKSVSGHHCQSAFRFGVCNGPPFRDQLQDFILPRRPSIREHKPQSGCPFITSLRLWLINLRWPN
jgi:hypothetical protein